jgi:hypothetical protein
MDYIISDVWPSSLSKTRKQIETILQKSFNKSFALTVDLDVSANGNFSVRQTQFQRSEYENEPAPSQPGLNGKVNYKDVNGKITFDNFNIVTGGIKYNEEMPLHFYNNKSVKKVFTSNTIKNFNKPLITKYKSTIRLLQTTKTQVEILIIDVQIMQNKMKNLLEQLIRFISKQKSDYDFISYKNRRASKVINFTAEEKNLINNSSFVPPLGAGLEPKFLQKLVHNNDNPPNFTNPYTFALQMNDRDSDNYPKEGFIAWYDGLATHKIKFEINKTPDSRGGYVYDLNAYNGILHYMDTDLKSLLMQFINQKNTVMLDIQNKSPLSPSPSSPSPSLPPTLPPITNSTFIQPTQAEITKFEKDPFFFSKELPKEYYFKINREESINKLNFYSNEAFLIRLPEKIDITFNIIEQHFNNKDNNQNYIKPTIYDNYGIVTKKNIMDKIEHIRFYFIKSKEFKELKLVLCSKDKNEFELMGEHGNISQETYKDLLNKLIVYIDKNMDNIQPILKTVKKPKFSKTKPGWYKKPLNLEERVGVLENKVNTITSIVDRLTFASPRVRSNRIKLGGGTRKSKRSKRRKPTKSRKPTKTRKPSSKSSKKVTKPKRKRKATQRKR